MSTKLELTWFGKENLAKPEPRVLIERKDLSYQKDNGSLIDKDINDNILIHGDNLLALKALEHDFAGKVKCIYIDPPYNTGSAFEHYDDNLEHSTWLSLMNPRLKIMKNLLKEDGVIFIQIDYNEQAYLKVLCDEIFGRANFITMITCKVKAPSGIASGANAFFDCSEYILVYSKNKLEFKFHQMKVDSMRIGPSAPTVISVYNQLLKKFENDKFKNYSKFEDIEVKVLEKSDFEVKTIPSKERTEDLYYHNFLHIFRVAAISGGRDVKVLKYLQSLPDYDKDKIYSYSYVASQGKNKGKYITNYIYKNGNILFLKDFVRVDSTNKVVYKQDILTNIFYNDWWQGLTNEGGVVFKNGQKPEKLISLLLQVVTDPGDIVLDSFLGSGTTCATAHKLRRKWIGIEMGDHVYSHCKYRLDNIINGLDQTGISKDVEWTGGGGYKFYELAPTLLKEDSFGQLVINNKYDAGMLYAAVAIHEGFKFDPDEKCFWKQGKSENNSFLFVTTQHVGEELINQIKSELKDNEFLLISCKSFDAGIDNSKNITLKKIPQSLLDDCEYGKDNYDLNIVCPPEYEEDEEDEWFK